MWTLSRVHTGWYYQCEDGSTEGWVDFASALWQASAWSGRICETAEKHVSGLARRRGRTERLLQASCGSSMLRIRQSGRDGVWLLGRFCVGRALRDRLVGHVILMLGISSHSESMSFCLRFFSIPVVFLGKIFLVREW